MNNERKKRIQQRKAREKDQRRHEIIMTAKDLFISKGYDNTTMADIALKASLSKGTLYNYFQNKDDLYLVVATIAIRKLNEFYEDIDLTSKLDIEYIMSLGYTVYEFSKKFPELYKIATDITSKPFYLNITRKLIEGVSLNRNEAEIMIERKRYRELIFNKIKEAIDNKIIRDDLSPNFLYLTITSLTGGLIDILTNFRIYQDFYGIDPDKIMDIVLEWVAEGIKPKKKEEK